MGRFGTTCAGEAVHAFTLANESGVRVTLITLGAAIAALHVPDAAGRAANVVLGFDDVAGYESPDNQYLGCVVGRVANRISSGGFTLDGERHALAINEPPANHLHGGVRGFDKHVWEAAPAHDRVVFRRTSPAGEEGYPGALDVEVAYALTEADELRIEYRATADAPTPVNLTNHAYFNLAGAGTILDHELTIAASAFTPADARLVPTGAIEPVAGKPLDFRSPTRIGARIGRGYDHNLVLDGSGLRFAARLAHPASGRALELSTTEPCLQLYTGNGLSGRFARHGALCLEAQRFPDAVNRPEFPSIVLRPGTEYRQTTVLRFAAA
jgi:aldose 1-epimerase